MRRRWRWASAVPAAMSTGPTARAAAIASRCASRCGHSAPTGPSAAAWRAMPTWSWRSSPPGAAARISPCTGATSAAATPAAAWTIPARRTSTISSPAAGAPPSSWSCAWPASWWRWPSPTWCRTRSRPCTPSTSRSWPTAAWAPTPSCARCSGRSTTAATICISASGCAVTRRWSTSAPSARWSTSTAPTGGRCRNDPCIAGIAAQCRPMHRCRTHRHPRACLFLPRPALPAVLALLLAACAAAPAGPSAPAREPAMRDRSTEPPPAPPPAGADADRLDRALTVPGGLRVATFNASLYDDAEGGLVARLRAGDGDARRVAAIIQHLRPDVLLLNEFDYDPEGIAAELFQRDYLEASQHGQTPIHYPWRYLAPVNTGVPSGLDLDGDGQAGGDGRQRGNDAWGYGLHPGQYGMLVLSQYPLDAGAARSFRLLKWSAMPGASQPQHPDAR